ncbi:MAG: thiamine pyrophosphate-dependent dehydrogenase E1 component subunit alpha [Anaerolineae bacterium]|nr:thiamine pyrophosphate-dependent dehydrogenase E1 component subunit alpha [Anaerolineae bacterium]
MYSTMWRIRVFEEAVSVLFREGRIIGFAHVSIGQEAVATGACLALGPKDYSTASHRGPGPIAARGARLDLMMAELYGKATGYCRGKGGSVHLADFERGILGANGIVGAGIVIAAGAALSAKMRKSGEVALAFFGDGAVNQGAFHEGLNIAAVWKLPAIFVCENNQYAVSMAAEQATGGGSIVARAAAYGMPGVQVDGQDVLAVYAAVRAAAERARAGGDPTLIECRTYRFHGHWEGEATDLRRREEIAEWEARCPIIRLGTRLLEAKIARQEQLDALRQKALEEMAAAIRFAESSPEPAPQEALEGVLLPL